MFLISTTGCSGWRSQGQTAFASAISDGGDATVVLVAATVEDDGLDAGSLGALGDELADLLGLGGLVTIEGPRCNASMVEADAKVLPTVSSTTWTKTWRDERDTTRRGRPVVPVTTLRTRKWRRAREAPCPWRA